MKSMNVKNSDKKFNNEHCMAHVQDHFLRRYLIQKMMLISLTGTICLVIRKTHNVDERTGSLLQHRSTNYWFYCCTVTYSRVSLTSRVYAVEVWLPTPESSFDVVLRLRRSCSLMSVLSSVVVRFTSCKSIMTCWPHTITSTITCLFLKTPVKMWRRTWKKYTTRKCHVVSFKILVMSVLANNTYTNRVLVRVVGQVTDTVHQIRRMRLRLKSKIRTRHLGHLHHPVLRAVNNQRKNIINLTIIIIIFSYNVYALTLLLTFIEIPMLSLIYLDIFFF